MLVSHSVMGQLEFKSLHYREQLFNPISSFKDTITNHSSILPRIEIKENFKPLPCFKSNSTFLNAFSVTPLINLVGGIELNSSSDSRFIYDAGIGATVNFNTKKNILYWEIFTLFHAIGLCSGFCTGLSN